jgi:hypothetical protein
MSIVDETLSVAGVPVVSIGKESIILAPLDAFEAVRARFMEAVFPMEWR